MNNKSKILAGCLTLLLALSVGYALFSETITINGTATAKGSFDIGITCTGGMTSNLKPYLLSAAEMDGTIDYYDYPDDNGFSEESCQVNGSKITYSATLDYPGAARYFIVKATNNGTIPAKIAHGDALYGGIMTSETCEYNKSDDSLVRCSDTSIVITGGFSGHSLFIAAEDTSGNLYGWDNNELENKFLDNGDFILKEDESFYFVYFVSWDSTWTDKTKYLTHVETGDMPFKQITN